ncbi:MAG TPA: recombinase family protein [Terriglobia bacterium]|nr:recombinase family protein [Terriglobia bacterium]
MNVCNDHRPPLQTEARAQFPLSNKISACHLERSAIVYVRQSSARQVRENIESTQLQYRLVDRARALGWSDEHILVIDDDLGLGGQSLEGREGFQRLLAEVSLGHVGIVMGTEMSRLARSCRDWHHLLELCALFGTLLGDADGVYDPRDHNDRLLLGLKGTMSEAELHILRGRLDAGRKNKARRGEYFAQAPIGYVRTTMGVAIDPDEQVSGVVRLLFEKFEELGSANALLMFFRREQIHIGIRKGPGQGVLAWRVPNRSTLLGVLHHPIYAGAYVFGRNKTDPSRRVSGKPASGRRRATRDEWQVLVHDALPAYINWAQWERNQQRLAENSTKYGVGAARGASLVAGRVVCSRCARRMAVQYKENNQPYFRCSAARCQCGDPECQSFGGKELEALVVRQVLCAMEPASLELSLKAAECIESDRERLEQHHRQTVQRAAYEVELARRRYEEVDPSNRLVAAELERRWEASLQTRRKAEETLNRFRHEQPASMTAQQRQAIVDLAHDIPALWHSAAATNVDRQQIVRSLIERIVVGVQGQTERLSVTIHWSGGYESHHEIRRRVNTFGQLHESTAIATRIEQLYDEGYPLSEIARLLNQDGFTPAKGPRFTQTSIGALCRTLRRKGVIAKQRRAEPHFWRAGDLSRLLGVKKPTLSGWRKRHWVQARQVGSRWIYWADGEELQRLRRLTDRRPNGSTPAPAELRTPISKMPTH